MSGFIEYLSDVFIEFGEIKARRMFGGHGLYFDEYMFALVADDRVYLKVDEKNIHHFKALELPAFEYQKTANKTVTMSFNLAPDSIYDDPSEAAQWAAQSWEAAMRAKAKKVKRKKSVRS